ncbi:hypothetical protein [Endozoicomonas elysicola]|uniref:hypothetical protein n=1 Tax=Endozoicomonas elysicola TaxID=305900 RepID=UPI00039A9106|nr:hypothetical protein [Endozoicomonas elysicola]
MYAQQEKLYVKRRKNIQMIINSLNTSRSEIANNDPIQLIRNVTHDTVNFTFDGTGAKTRPAPPGTPTNPIGRSAWPNQMIAANLITGTNNNGMYQSGHQIAHRFNGSDVGDNVAAWPDNQETAYSVEENKIDMGLAANRVNEHGKLSVTTGYYASKLVLYEMVDECLDAMRAHLQTQANWDNLNAGSANAHPPSQPTDAELLEGLTNLFNTQQYQVTDDNVANTVKMKYEAKNGSKVNAARSFEYSDYSIDLPTWTTNQLHWRNYLLQNKPRISVGGENFRLER